MTASIERQTEQSENPLGSGLIKAIWVLTAAAALLLSLASIDLVARISAERAGSGVTAYLASDSKVVVLRRTPGRSAGVAAIVDGGTSVEILATVTEQKATWYQVKAAAGMGWVLAEFVSFDPPKNNPVSR